MRPKLGTMKFADVDLRSFWPIEGRPNRFHAEAALEAYERLSNLLRLGDWQSLTVNGEDLTKAMLLRIEANSRGIVTLEIERATELAS